GGAGDDILIGGAGNDTMDGGYGSDTFIFDFNDDAVIGADTIQNFSVYDDLILISGLPADSIGDLDIEYTAGNAVIDFGEAGSVTLLGVDPNFLTEQHFSFPLYV
ncbi:M10 family metallopeptidase C-terminal domain-containing protein, partial [Pseudorhodoplanes sp.]|uniref:M10 family metallopeptidase C-terminal domain-containing protein n=1 Tax=Pseudorhodoplanes sp. TaxID=1934341 RepID=UPI002C780095|nr:hypothetical protein [Pseudorhodoplanes sp.]